MKKPKRDLMNFKGWVRLAHRGVTLDLPHNLVARDGVRFNPQTRIVTVEFMADSVSLVPYEEGE